LFFLGPRYAYVMGSAPPSIPPTTSAPPRALRPALLAAALGIEVTEGSAPRLPLRAESVVDTEDDLGPPSSPPPVALRPGALRDVLARLG
jgi:hypothetical protein